MRVSSMTARRLSSTGRSSGTKACGALRAWRLRAAWPALQRQTRSGAMPMMEYRLRAVPFSMLSSRKELGRPAASFM